MKVIKGNTTLLGDLYVPVSEREVVEHVDQNLFPRCTSESQCVVYLHSQSTNRLEGRFLIDYLLPKKISLMTFDFGGAGASSEKYLTLGL